MLVREAAPAHQITAVAPDGTRVRWAGDEKDPSRVPSGLQWSTSIPGGSDTLRCTLPRDPERAYPDLGLLSELQVIRDGGRTQTYRLEETPKVSGDQMAIEPAAKGYRAALEDRADVRALFIDRDVSRWGPMGRARRISLLPTKGISDPSSYVDPTSGYPAFTIELDGEWDASYPPWGEAWYDAGEGLKVGRVYATSEAVNVASTDWGHQLWATDNDTNTGGTLLSSIGYASTTVDSTLATPTRFVFFLLYWGTAAAGTQPNAVYAEQYKRPWVLGDHGLTPVGSGGDLGFYTGTMLEWLVQSQTSLSTGTIEDGTFLQTHAAYRDSSTALSIIENLSRYEPLYDWAVWDREFSFQRRGSYGKRWRARVGPSGLRSSGESLERLYNEVAVKVNDPLYGELIVGPTGSGYSNTSAYLIDSDTDNPANRAGVTRRALMDIGEGTAAGAIEVGRRFLDETKRLDNSGQCVLTGYVEDDAGTYWPVDEVRAGDSISFTDSADTSWRHIAATDYSADSQTNSLSIDAPPQTLDGLLARLQAVLVPLG